MQYDLVFQGGGAKGMAFVGAMREFERRDHSFRRLVGTSAGAINAALLAAGYDAEQMAAALDEKDDEGRPVFESFMKWFSLEDIRDIPVEESFSAEIIDVLLALVEMFGERFSIPVSSITAFISGLKSSDPNIRIAALQALVTAEEFRGRDDGWFKWIASSIGSVYSLIEQGGWFSADKFVEWLERKLAEKDPRYAGASMRSFYDMTGHDLSLCVADITGQKLLVLNHRTSPDVPLIWAVRMSMSIPFVWPPVTWQTTWGTYQGSVIAGHSIIDGGALSNFAVRLTTSTGPAIKSVMADDPNISDIAFSRFNNAAPTLGFMLDGNLEVEGLPPLPESEDFFSRASAWMEMNSQRKNVLSVLTNSLNSMMVGNDNFNISSLEDSICRLPVDGIGTLEFDMSPARQSALIDAAENASRNFFDNSLEFVVNELFLQVGDDGKFQIGCDINGTPGKNDWIGLFTSPDASDDDYTEGNWVRVKPGENLFTTATEANFGQYEARYFATGSGGFFGIGRTYKLLLRTGPINRVVAK